MTNGIKIRIAALQSQESHASHPNSGLFLGLLAVMFGVAMDGFAKLATATGSTWQLVFLRWGYAVALLLPLMLYRKDKRDWTLKPVHFRRMVLNLVASLCLYWSLSHLKLSTAVTIFFVEPLATALAARVLLAEVVTPARWVAGFGGLVGVIIVAWPTTGGQDSTVSLFAPVVALLGAATWSVQRVLTKRDGRDTSVLSLMFWLAVATSLVSAPVAIANWQANDSITYLVSFCVALLGTAQNVLLLKAFKIAPASQIANLGYLVLPFSYVVGFIFFGEQPELHVYVGSVVIFIVIFLAQHSRYEAFLQRWIDQIFHSPNRI